VILPAQYGQQEADRLVEEWAQTFAPLAPWAEAAVSAGPNSNQLVWSLQSVPTR
jgi:hypothetical protein